MNNTNIIDNRTWYIGKIPYNKDFNSDLAKAYCGAILSDLGLTTRL